MILAGSGGRMCSLAMYSLAASVSRLRSSRQPFSTARTFASVRFFASERFKQSPVRFRSSVRSAMPLETARSGRAESSFDRFKTISPLSAARAPKIVSTSSVRPAPARPATPTDRKSTRLNSSHTVISYAVFCLKKKKKKKKKTTHKQNKKNKKKNKKNKHRIKQAKDIQKSR